MPPKRSAKRESGPTESPRPLQTPGLDARRSRADPRDRSPAGPRPQAAVGRAAAVREITGPMYVDTEKGQFVDRAPPSEPAITRRQLESEYARLLRAFDDAEENPGSFSSQGCRNCAGCMFCVDCAACYRCTHCAQCRDSSHLTHCRDCTACYDSAYCVRCESCTGSSYLVLCRSCSDCTYCFGCVGLTKKDFHILNVQYSKTEYFRIVKALRMEMGL